MSRIAKDKKNESGPGLLATLALIVSISAIIIPLFLSHQKASLVVNQVTMEHLGEFASADAVAPIVTQATVELSIINIGNQPILVTNAVVLYAPRLSLYGSECDAMDQSSPLVANWEKRITADKTYRAIPESVPGGAIASFVAAYAPVAPSIQQPDRMSTDYMTCLLIDVLDSAGEEHRVKKLLGTAEVYNDRTEFLPATGMKQPVTILSGLGWNR